MLAAGTPNCIDMFSCFPPWIEASRRLSQGDNLWCILHVVVCSEISHLELERRPVCPRGAVVVVVAPAYYSPSPTP